MKAGRSDRFRRAPCKLLARRRLPRPVRQIADLSFECLATGDKVVYRRYASLFFVAGIAPGDNELATLEIIHRYVEVLDRYFGNVSNRSYFVPAGSKTVSPCAARCS